MKAVIDKATNVVVFAFYDTDYVELTESRLLATDITALDVNSSTHSLEQVPDNQLFVGGLWRWTAIDGWVCTNKTMLVSSLGPNIYADVQVSIQELLDVTAKQYEYDSIHTACGWGGVLEDATALKNWGAACWNISKQIKDEVLAGTRELSTAAEIMNEMPEFIKENYL